jgi:opacity protein-like surface antigen
MTAVSALAVACFVGATPVAAQRARPHFGVGGGATFPSGDYHQDAVGEGFNTGWIGLGFLELKGRGPLGWRLELSYGENPANDQLTTGAAVDEGGMHLLCANLDLTLRSPGARAYLLGGIGGCQATLWERTSGVKGDSSESKFAWNVGGGVSGGGKRAVPFLEVRYTHVATVFDAITLPFFMAIAGVRF